VASIARCSHYTDSEHLCAFMFVSCVNPIQRSRRSKLKRKRRRLRHETQMVSESLSQRFRDTRLRQVRICATSLKTSSRRCTSSAEWCGGAVVTASDFEEGLQGSALSLAPLYSNFLQVIHSYVPLSPSSISWHWPKGSEALQLGRKPQGLVQKQWQSTTGLK